METPCSNPEHNILRKLLNETMDNYIESQREIGKLKEQLENSASLSVMNSNILDVKRVVMDPSGWLDKLMQLFSLWSQNFILCVFYL